MTYTENYALNQWAKTDRIQMSDFNADNAKIDAALKANANAIAAKADSSALSAETNARTAAISQLSAAMPRFAAGTYTGDGVSTGQTITLAFPIKAVFIWMQASHYGSGGDWPNAALCTDAAAYTDDMVKISGSSFTVKNKDGRYPKLNLLDYDYNYIAFG